MSYTTGIRAVCSSRCSLRHEGGDATAIASPPTDDVPLSLQKGIYGRVVLSRWYGTYGTRLRL